MQARVEELEQLVAQLQLEVLELCAVLGVSLQPSLPAALLTAKRGPAPYSCSPALAPDLAWRRLLQFQPAPRQQPRLLTPCRAPGPRAQLAHKISLLSRALTATRCAGTSTPGFGGAWQATIGAPGRDQLLQGSLLGFSEGFWAQGLEPSPSLLQLRSRSWSNVGALCALACVLVQTSTPSLPVAVGRAPLLLSMSASERWPKRRRVCCRGARSRVLSKLLLLRCLCPAFGTRCPHGF